MKKESSVGIVIVNYNGAKFQNDCVKSLLENSHKNIKIIIVDNGSVDKSMEMLNDFDTDKIVKVFLNDNTGVATGNNKGIEKSRELGMEYTLLLNNDVEVEPDFLDLLLDEYEDKCLLVPKMFYYDDKTLLCYGGGRFYKNKASAIHLFDKCKDLETNAYEKYCNYAPTTCMLIKNSDFDIIGVMDDDYFLYYDDVDFVYRACQKGYRIKFVQKSVIYHKDGLSTGSKKSKISIYYNSRNKLYFVYKNKLPFRTKLYTKLSRFVKMVLADKEERKIIKQAIHDFKSKKMGRMS